MNTFLENICNDILENHKGIISDICVVFPSRRAGIFFKNELSKKISSPIWSPDVFSIQDFIEELSEFNFTDNLELLFELYSVYSDVFKNDKIEFESSTEFIESFDDEESFDSFYPWGEMLLKDFDLIDKYLVDADILFKRIKDLKEIEEYFPVELQDTFKKFWGTLFDSKSTLAKKNFLKIWQVLGKVYIEFKERLAKRNLCYPGMAYRKVYEDLKNDRLEMEWKKIFFSGFNALSNAEKKIMGMLMDKGLAEIYWDADDYYISDKNHEAGNFIRKNLKLFSQSGIKFENNLKNENKNINIIGVSSSMGMAKALGSELKEIINNIDIEKTAIILPDENLLLPVLYSIPEEIKNINVTMGFPFKDTPLYSLINLLIELQSNCIFEKGNYKFHYTSIEKILLHPYIKFQATGFIYNILGYLKKNNIVYYNFDESKDTPGIIKNIFKKISVISEVEEYISYTLNIINDRIEKDESSDSDYKIFQLEYIYNFYVNFNRLNEVVRKYSPVMNTETYWKLLKELIARTSIPFTGEPLKGLQVMGLLETRTLDFENVFLLSLNEGVLPHGLSENSFIPYSLRKALKIPTYEDEDSVEAYYFFRLLQRAKNIFLIYNTDFGNEVKEKSRYILQIENELIPVNKKISYINKIVIPEVSNPEKKSIEIIKNKEVMGKILAIEHYSPSKLNKYINCSLQFYFKEIAKVEEEIEIEESFSSMLIGNVLHSILEDIYTPYIGKTIIEKDIADIKIFLERNFKSVLENAVKINKSDYVLKEYEGKNYLFEDIIRKLLDKVLENEKSQVPFKIIDLEKEIDNVFVIQGNDKQIFINIKGRIDRIDGKNGVTRIIDYKTGGYILKKYDENNPSKYFEEFITNPDYKDNFQAFFYAYFFSKISDENKINVGIYPIKKMQNGIDDLKTGYIEKTEFDLFEDSLKKIFMEIFNPDVPFRQVEDEKRCMYCPYSGICYRDLKNTI